jgi:hypothetical protein
MAQCDVNYPTEFPLGCFQNAVTIITSGQLVEREQELEVAAYNIVGYGLRTLRGIPQPPIGSHHYPMTDEEFGAALELLEAIEGQPRKATDLQTLLELLLPLVLSILKQLLGHTS